MGERLNLEAEPPSVELRRVAPPGAIRQSPYFWDYQRHSRWGSGRTREQFLVLGTETKRNLVPWFLSLSPSREEERCLKLLLLVLFTRDKRFLAVRQTKNYQ